MSARETGGSRGWTSGGGANGMMSLSGVPYRFEEEPPPVVQKLDADGLKEAMEDDKALFAYIDTEDDARRGLDDKFKKFEEHARNVKRYRSEAAQFAVVSESIARPLIERCAAPAGDVVAKSPGGADSAVFRAVDGSAKDFGDYAMISSFPVVFGKLCRKTAKTYLAHPCVLLFTEPGDEKHEVYKTAMAEAATRLMGNGKVLFAWVNSGKARGFREHLGITSVQAIAIVQGYRYKTELHNGRLNRAVYTLEGELSADRIVAWVQSYIDGTMAALPARDLDADALEAANENERDVTIYDVEDYDEPIAFTVGRAVQPALLRHRIPYLDADALEQAMGDERALVAFIMTEDEGAGAEVLEKLGKFVSYLPRWPKRGETLFARVKVGVAAPLIDKSAAKAGDVVVKSAGEADAVVFSTVDVTEAEFFAEALMSSLPVFGELERWTEVWLGRPRAVLFAEPGNERHEAYKRVMAEAAKRLTGNGKVVFGWVDSRKRRADLDEGRELLREPVVVIRRDIEEPAERIFADEFTVDKIVAWVQGYIDDTLVLPAVLELDADGLRKAMEDDKAAFVFIQTEDEAGREEVDEKLKKFEGHARQVASFRVGKAVFACVAESVAFPLIERLAAKAGDVVAKSSGAGDSATFSIVDAMEGAFCFSKYPKEGCDSAFPVVFGELSLELLVTYSSRSDLSRCVLIFANRGNQEHKKCKTAVAEAAKRMIGNEKVGFAWADVNKEGALRKHLGLTDDHPMGIMSRRAIDDLWEIMEEEDSGIDFERCTGYWEIFEGEFTADKIVAWVQSSIDGTGLVRDLDADGLRKAMEDKRALFAFIQTEDEAAVAEVDVKFKFFESSAQQVMRSRGEETVFARVSESVASPLIARSAARAGDVVAKSPGTGDSAVFSTVDASKPDFMDYAMILSFPVGFGELPDYFTIHYRTKFNVSPPCVVLFAEPGNEKHKEDMTVMAEAAKKLIGNACINGKVLFAWEDFEREPPFYRRAGLTKDPTMAIVSPGDWYKCAVCGLRLVLDKCMYTFEEEFTTDKIVAWVQSYIDDTRGLVRDLDADGLKKAMEDKRALFAFVQTDDEAAKAEVDGKFKKFERHARKVLPFRPGNAIFARVSESVASPLIARSAARAGDVVAKSPGTGDSAVFSTVDGSKEDFGDYAMISSFPVVFGKYPDPGTYHTHLSRRASETYQSHPCVLLFTEPGDENHEVYKTAMEEAATRLFGNGKVLFAWTDGSLFSFDAPHNIHALASEARAWPHTVAIVEPNMSKWYIFREELTADIIVSKWYIFREELTADNIVSWVHSYIDGNLTPIIESEPEPDGNLTPIIESEPEPDGNLTPIIKSEPEPETNDGPVKVVVGDSWERIVMDPSKDVLVALQNVTRDPKSIDYDTPNSLTPFADPSPLDRMEHIVEALGSKLAGVESIVVAKINVDTNELPGHHLTAGSLVWFGAGEKKDYIEYLPDDWEEQNLGMVLSFVRENATVKFEVPAASAADNSDELDEGLYLCIDPSASRVFWSHWPRNDSNEEFCVDRFYDYRFYKEADNLLQHINSCWSSREVPPTRTIRDLDADSLKEAMEDEKALFAFIQTGDETARAEVDVKFEKFESCVERVRSFRDFSESALKQVVAEVIFACVPESAALALIERSGAKAGDVAVKSPGGADSAAFWTVDGTTEDFTLYALTSSFPVFDEVKVESGLRYASHTCVLLRAEPGNVKHDDHKVVVAEAAKRLRGNGRVLFAWVESWSNFPSRLAHWGLTSKHALAIVQKPHPFEPLCVEEDLYLFEDELTADKVVGWVQSYMDGHLTPLTRSEPEPETNDEDVKVVVGSSWERIVMDPRKDVLVAQYEPGSREWTILEPILKELATRLAGVDSVVIAKMDLTGNDAPLKTEFRSAVKHRLRFTGERKAPFYLFFVTTTNFVTWRCFEPGPGDEILSGDDRFLLKNRAGCLELIECLQLIRLGATRNAEMIADIDAVAKVDVVSQDWRDQEPSREEMVWRRMREWEASEQASEQTSSVSGCSCCRDN